MSLSYHPLCLVDVSVHAIEVHNLLAHLVLPVLLQHASKLVGCPPVVETIPCLQILHQPIGVPRKVLEKPSGPLLGLIVMSH
jgi:hypothetical protein